jgi:hypothetical protein
MERTTPRGQALVMGVVLILIGVVYLAIELVPRLRDIDVNHYGWPVLVILPGLVLIGAAGALPEASGLCVPGGIVIMAGLVLLVQNVFGLFATATYTWALVAPGGIGLGMWLQGMVDEAPALRASGRETLGFGFIVFLLSALFFETVHVSGRTFPLLIRLLLGVLIVAVGIALVVRRSMPSTG